MKVSSLRPRPQVRHRFHPADEERIPVACGCYVITDNADNVLYIGKASRSIRSRFKAHQSDKYKRVTLDGRRPVNFFYTLHVDFTGVERGWINIAIAADGKLPPFNLVDAT